MTRDLLWILGAYLVGSIPFGLLIARSRGIDIREHGSGNIGATNVGRVLGRKYGAFCFVLDFLKGLFPTLGAGLATGRVGSGAGLSGAGVPGGVNALGWLAVAIAAVLGHVFPVWLGFKGGKGVATGFGALLGVFPVLTFAGALAAAVWAVSLRLTRYVGVSSCLASLTLPLGVGLWHAWSGWRDDAGGDVGTDVGTGVGVNAGGAGADARALWPYLAITAAMAALVLWTHRGNLRRTLAGTENKVGAKRAGATPDR